MLFKNIRAVLFFFLTSKVGICEEIIDRRNLYCNRKGKKRFLINNVLPVAFLLE